MAGIERVSYRSGFVKRLRGVEAPPSDHVRRQLTSPRMSSPWLAPTSSTSAAPMATRRRATRSTMTSYLSSTTKATRRSSSQPRYPPVLHRQRGGEAAALGIAEITLRRARKALGVQVRREGFGKDGRFLLVLPSVGAGDVAGERIASHMLARREILHGRDHLRCRTCVNARRLIPLSFTAMGGLGRWM